MSNIQKQSRRIRIFFQVFAVLMPIMVCYFWLTVGKPSDILSASGIFRMSFDINTYTQHPLTMTTRFLAIIASLLLTCILLYALMILINLFRNYERNEIFSIDNANYYRKLSYCIFYWVGGSVVYDSIMSVILSFNNPPGQRVLTVSIYGIDFLTILFGFIILIISWIMKEGYLLADEKNYTI